MTFPLTESAHVSRLGDCWFPSPIQRVVPETIVLPGTAPDGPPVDFERAGPRPSLFFDPQKVRAALVTCGGLCPGINNVLRSVFLELHYRYGVKDILGIPYKSNPTALTDLMTGRIQVMFQLITGIAHDKNEAKITLVAVPDRPGAGEQHQDHEPADRPEAPRPDLARGRLAGLVGAGRVGPDR